MPCQSQIQAKFFFIGFNTQNKAVLYDYSEKISHTIWNKVFQNGLDEICGRNSLKNLK